MTMPAAGVGVVPAEAGGAFIPALAGGVMLEFMELAAPPIGGPGATLVTPGVPQPVAPKRTLQTLTKDHLTLIMIENFSL
jgi:hypothetical protein